MRLFTVPHGIFRSYDCGGYVTVRVRSLFFLRIEAPMYKILIVDDREIFRRQFKRFKIFKDNKDFTVAYEAEDGEKALAILREHDVDVTISDIRMPIMDGIRLLGEIKKDNLCSCVVFLSEYADFSYARQGIVLGAFDYIVKPIDENKLKELLDRVKDYLSAKPEDYASISQSRIERICQFMLSDDPYAEKMCGELADGIIQSAQNDVHATELLNNILGKMKAVILTQRDYLEALIDTESLFTLSYHDGMNIYDEFMDAIRHIEKEINRFNIGARNELVRSICKSVLKNTGKNISLQRMADLHFVNNAYLSHLFRKETGMSFVDYVSMVKIEYAKRRLESTTDKIYEIAVDLEYSDAEYFGKVFKQRTGYTPSAYRQEFGKKQGGI